MEDSATLHMMISNYLQSQDYEVTGAVDGEQAIELAEAAKEPIDLVLCDITLPGQDGITVADKLRLRNPELAVVLMSGERIDPSRNVDSSYGFLAKPFRMAELVSSLTAGLQP